MQSEDPHHSNAQSIWSLPRSIIGIEGVLLTSCTMCGCLRVLCSSTSRSIWRFVKCVRLTLAYSFTATVVPVRMC